MYFQLDRRDGDLQFSFSYGAFLGLTANETLFFNYLAAITNSISRERGSISDRTESALKKHEEIFKDMKQFNSYVSNELSNAKESISENNRLRLKNFLQKYQLQSERLASATNRLKYAYPKEIKTKTYGRYTLTLSERDHMIYGSSLNLVASLKVRNNPLTIGRYMTHVINTVASRKYLNQEILKELNGLVGEYKNYYNLKNECNKILEDITNEKLAKDVKEMLKNFPDDKGEEFLHTNFSPLDRLKILNFLKSNQNKYNQDQVKTLLDNNSILKSYEIIYKLENNLGAFNVKNQNDFRKGELSFEEKLRICNTLNSELVRYKNIQDFKTDINIPVRELQEGLTDIGSSLSNYSENIQNNFYKNITSLSKALSFRKALKDEFTNIPESGLIKIFSSELLASDLIRVTNELRKYSNGVLDEFCKSNYTMKELGLILENANSYEEKFKECIGAQSYEQLSIKDNATFKQLAGLQKLKELNNGEVLSPIQIEERKENRNDRLKNLNFRNKDVSTKLKQKTSGCFSLCVPSKAVIKLQEQLALIDKGILETKNELNVLNCVSEYTSKLAKAQKAMEKTLYCKKEKGEREIA